MEPTDFALKGSESSKPQTTDKKIICYIYRYYRWKKEIKVNARPKICNFSTDSAIWRLFVY